MVRSLQSRMQAWLACVVLHALAWVMLEKLDFNVQQPTAPKSITVHLMAQPAPLDSKTWQRKRTLLPNSSLPDPLAAPASQAAPLAPSAQDWAFAAGYTLKNSKGYRHNWGRQVRSMMGTAVEGPDQGMVRFRIEIAPNGTLVRLETLWSTSPVAEQKARLAVAQMPPLPPTPTGKPLVFEKTIVFSPFAHDDTPLYRHDCEPDVPAFRNPFVWDGQSDKWRDDDPPPVKVLSGQALEDCRKQLPPETVQSEATRDQRVMDRWGSSRTGQPATD